MTDGPVIDKPVIDPAGPPRRRVVIAEDEALIRLDLAEMLREEGYEVVGEAGDGQEAVDLVESLRPDLVIMDVKMPRRDGIDAAAEIAAKRIAPIVVLTAFSQRDLVEKARDAGAMAYLVKPFSISDLVPAIEVALSYTKEPLGAAFLPLLLLLMGVKFFAVLYYFMHLKFDSRLFSLMFYMGLVLAVGCYIVFLTTMHFFNG